MSYLEDDPRTCKYSFFHHLRSPWSSAIWKGSHSHNSHNPRSRGLTDHHDYYLQTQVGWSSKDLDATWTWESPFCSGVHGSLHAWLVSWVITYFGDLKTYLYWGYNLVTKYHGHPSRMQSWTTRWQLSFVFLEDAGTKPSRKRHGLHHGKGEHPNIQHYIA